MRTFGVEEEFLLVDPLTRCPVPAASAVLTMPATERDWQPAGAGARVTGELQLEQLEVSTDPCGTLAVLADQLRAGRAAADAAAQAGGARIAVLATSPLPATPHLRTTPRYRRMADLHGLVAAEQLTCGMHIHVEVASDDEGVGVLDRIRIWLPFLLALSANSPYWNGNDTGYSSFRSRVWNRWPTTGPTPIFGSARAYGRLVDSLLDTGVLLDPGMVYFDARLSRHFPTVEIRVADVCLDVATAEVLAGLARALVETAAAQWRADVAPPAVPEALLRAAMWLAARNGLGSELLDPSSFRPVPAAQVAAGLLSHLSAALGPGSEGTRIRHLLHRSLTRGTGADWQRREFARHVDRAEVVLAAIGETQGGRPGQGPKAPEAS
ncbi:glutamate--cysteine ligase [Arthrobacter sp. SDTb3-6]|uniref:carboxylate-amine ligase n=1 Tax=Arthrobacter sp. SDTb3-6 TaxID=2713571 RepID=UPI00159E1AF5|nr:glutamate--cysteine ligase [Arthrobacter sp. SDTb3-6]NVM98698.1 YbdK family carboxylate-amine ligase [Arthrobacter sp. SDTb3-6]